MKKVRVSFAGVVAAIAVLGFGLFGCDQGSSHYELTITPSEKELTANNALVRFEVTEGLRELSLPLKWDVSNSAVGGIVAQEGGSAIYQRFRSGVNIVHVTDQYGSEGIASISNPIDESSSSSGYNLILVANPSETISIGVHTVTITAVNGQSPYAWSVGDSSKGSVPVGSSSDAVVYTSSTNGDNTVICVDANSARGTITITQE